MGLWQQMGRAKYTFMGLWIYSIDDRLWSIFHF